MSQANTDLNPLMKLVRGIVTRSQKDEIYSTNDDPIDVEKLKKQCPEIQLMSFKDNNGKEHRFLYKPPQKDSPTTMHFGGSDLNYNNYEYKVFLKDLHEANPSHGIVIPIYPGFHDKTTKPSETKLKDSALKIYGVVTGSNEVKELRSTGKPTTKIEPLSPKSIQLVGYSLGGPIAAHVASTAGDDATKLVLISSPTSIRDVSAENALKLGGLSAIVSRNPKLFGEEYSTTKELERLSPNTEVLLVSSSHDQFAIPLQNGKPSHFEQLSTILGKRKNSNSLLIEDTPDNKLLPEDFHGKNLTNPKVLEIVTQKAPTPPPTYMQDIKDIPNLESLRVKNTKETNITPRRGNSSSQMQL